MRLGHVSARDLLKSEPLTKWSWDLTLLMQFVLLPVTVSVLYKVLLFCYISENKSCVC